MTIAICIACGAEKFGAFVCCPRCGYEPQTTIDKAKSLMLSDRNLSTGQLHDCKALIEAGKEVPYDPISLAYCAEPIAEEDYFWEHLDESRGLLPCIRCGAPSNPKLRRPFAQGVAPTVRKFCRGVRNARSFTRAQPSFVRNVARRCKQNPP